MNNKEREHYMKRIRKTLAMAKSPNQFEAESALLKAREMMAKYKLFSLFVFYGCVHMRSLFV